MEEKDLLVYLIDDSKDMYELENIHKKYDYLLVEIFDYDEEN